MGNFDDLIPSSHSKTSGNFDEFIPTSKIPKPENFLQQAIKSIQQTQMPSTMPGYNPQNPLQMAAQVGNSVINNSLGPAYNIANNMKSNMIGDAMPNNPVGAGAVDIATNPLTYVGLSGAGKVAGETAANVLNPSKVFGEKLASQNGTVDFFPHIMKAIDDPVAGKLIDKAGILDKFGGTVLGEGGMPTEKLSNLSAEDSQNVINSLKDEVTKAVKEGTLKPKQLQVGKLFGDLSDAQNDAFEGMKDAKFGYGLGKNTQKIASGAFKKIITGSEIGAGGGLAWSAIKHLFGK